MNVTKEVDNFFPAHFKYLKIWASDEDETELLMHWQKTYDFIKEAKYVFVDYVKSNSMERHRTEDFAFSLF